MKESARCVTLSLPMNGYPRPIPPIVSRSPPGALPGCPKKSILPDTHRTGLGRVSVRTIMKINHRANRRQTNNIGIQDLHVLSPFLLSKWPRMFVEMRTDQHLVCRTLFHPEPSAVPVSEKNKIWTPHLKKMVLGFPATIQPTTNSAIKYNILKSNTAYKEVLAKPSSYNTIVRDLGIRTPWTNRATEF